MQLVATVPFLGKIVEVYLVPKSWSTISFDGKKFTINKSIGTNFDKLNHEFNNYCQKQLHKIIDNQIYKLRRKNIDVELMYTDGVKTFPKKITTSVDKYLKEIGYSNTIDYKIGEYEKEWGINEINPKNKHFTLYFNQNLIKYDDGPHIEYVTAHELTHIFHRDHGDGFNASLKQLFSKKNSSEEFFKTGISKRFGLPSTNNSYFMVVVLILLLLFVIIAYQWVSSFLASLFPNLVPTNNAKF